MKYSILRTLDYISSGIERGLHLGAQVCVLRNGETIIETAVGNARPDVPMSSDTILFWLSAGKPLTAIAIAQLIERGRLALDAKVVDFIPEFAEHGKDKITVRHILTHTGGFRTGDLVPDDLPWAEGVSRVCEARMEPGWEPGKKAGYHSLGSWLILGELIRLIDGRMPSEYLREELFLPLGMADSWAGMSREGYDAYEPKLGWFFDTSGEKPQYFPHWYGREAYLCGQPASRACGPARDLAKFYSMLLNGGELNGVRVLGKDLVKQWISRQRTGLFDHSFKNVVDWGHGFYINSRHYGVENIPYGYGPYASQDTFGHSGSRSSAAFVDPEKNMVVVVIFNGRPNEKDHQPRIRQTLTFLYEELGWTSQDQKNQA